MFRNNDRLFLDDNALCHEVRISRIALESSLKISDKWFGRNAHTRRDKSIITKGIEKKIEKQLYEIDEDRKKKRIEK